MDNKEKLVTVMRILAIVLMIVAFVISLIEFERVLYEDNILTPFRNLLGSIKHTILGTVFDPHKAQQMTIEHKTLRPNIESVIIASVMFIPLVFRGIFPLVSNKVFNIICNLILIILNILVLAAYVNNFIGTEATFDLIGLKLGPLHIVVFAIIFSWIGIKSISGIGWIIVIVLAISNGHITSQVMGIWGAIFVITSLVSFMIQLVFIQNTFYTLVHNIKDDFLNSASFIKNDIGAIGEYM